ncbi:MAG TPA: amidohydrolase family protein [Chitinophagaceae bacterium]|nr:amidohydrolase family protein [Chitinophagaceae bacterium]
MKLIFLFALQLLSFLLAGQTDSFFLLKPDRVFDGEQMRNDWVVLIKGNKIEAVGSMNFKLPSNTRIIELKGSTVLPGLIEGHSHLFLHPYNEVSWNDQVLKESRAERTARAVNHAKATLMAGFTTVRDLGTEGAMYDDVGLKIAIEKGLIPGPRMIVATRAIVAKGSYAPHSENADVDLPQGAEEVGGPEELSRIVRTQMSKGADVIKVYADYRYGPNGETRPAFTQDEWKMIMMNAKNGSRKVVAHAMTPEAMKMAAMAGVSTIEHGDEGTDEVFKLMKEKGVGFCATLAAGDAILQYRGWKKNTDPEPADITEKKKSFQAALRSGVTICMGGDVGVYTHGDNAREMELMVEYGMKSLDVLKSATSVNADVFGYADKIGRMKKGLFADLIAVQGDPSKDIKTVRNIQLVMKNGKIYYIQSNNN